MCFTYKKLDALLNRKGLSYNKLFEIGVVTNYTSRKLRAGKSVEVKYLVSVCKFLDVSIEDVIEISPDSE